MLVLLAFALPDAASDRLFDRCLAAHRASGAATIRAEQTIGQPPSASRTVFRVSYRRPDRLAITVSPSTGRGSRALWAGPGGITLLDRDSSLYTTFPYETKLSLSANVLSTNAGLDNLLLALVDPTLMQETLDLLRKGVGWRASSFGGVTTLSGTGASGKIEVGFLENGGRLRSLAVTSSDAQRMRWVFEYAALSPGLLNVALPKDARRVGKSTMDAKPEPKVEDKEARTLLEKTFDQYDRLREVAYRVDGEGGRQQVWFGELGVRQKGPRWEWAYRSGSLAIADHMTKRLFEGKCRPSEMTRLLNALGLSWDPTVRELMADRNPVRAILSNRMTVRTAGSIALGGQPCAILQATAPKIRLTLMLRRADGLVAGTTSDSLDERGQVVSTSERRFEYSSVRTRLPASALAVAATGYKRSPLAAIR
ncbi:MAG TPA: hypothetical protein PLL78_03015 [Fimbriimonadaceae bacterium]|nr:hypothetical protein [Fimbriimonadaceae bacterium]HRJ95631.1 hypothetical protein [Fimbriimonadaceae bacterium]